jgi:hypothetical protein
MVVILSLQSEESSRHATKSVQGVFELAAIIERPSTPGWTLPGLGSISPVQSDSASFFAPPLLWVSGPMRDAFSEFEESIEEAPREAVWKSFSADPGMESAESRMRVGPWVEVVTTRFVELLALRDNWNSHGACAISRSNILAAGRFLAAVMEPSTPAPIMVPTAGGGVQLEWHRAGFDVEVLFGEEDPPLLYVAEIDKDNEWEGHPVEGFAEFELAQRLTR